MNLKSELRNCLKEIVDDDWGEPIVLQNPDGKIYETAFDNPLKPLKAIFQNESREVDLMTGMDGVIDTPIITLRIDSLETIPKHGENWLIKAPPSPGAPLKSYSIASPVENGKTIGYIRIKLIDLAQS